MSIIPGRGSYPSLCPTDERKPVIWPHKALARSPLRP
jgi:hypothetical protein